MWQRALAGEQFIEIGIFGKPHMLRHYELRFNALHDQKGEILARFCSLMTSVTGYKSRNAWPRPKKHCAKHRRWKP